MSLILCRHEPVKHPYYIDVLGIHIHSSQELCYVIYNHPILVMDDFIDELLIEFIRRDLDMDYLAGRMEKLLETGSRHEDVLFLFLSECDYYNDKEIQKYKTTVAALRALHPAEYENLVIVSGVALGGEAGFLTGALAMLLSNVMYGQGPWTPWQMFAMGLCGFLAGVLYRRGLLRRGRVSLCIYGALSALLIYGVLMNVSSALLWQSQVSWATIGAYLLSGFPVDCVHAAATVCFLWLFGEPMLEKLDRIKVKYGLLA